jgi:4-amino-4-deoxy-L-arabinose transferase-like glycosyltransferase
VKKKRYFNISMRWPWIIPVVLALGIRLIALNQSFWLDEAISANVVKNLSFGDIVLKFGPTDFHPPLFYWMLKLWSQIWGSGEVTMRLMSVLAGVVTVWTVYKIGEDQKKPHLGWWAAMLLAANPLLVYYSQENRMYAMVTMFLIIGWRYWLKNNVIKSVFFLVLAWWTFYGAIFFIAGLGIISLVKKQYRQAAVLSIGTGIGVAATLPLLLLQLNNSAQQVRIISSWGQILGKADLKNLLLVPIKFTIGRISFYPKWAYWLVATGAVGMTALAAIPGSIKRKEWLWLLILPIILGWMVSWRVPLLSYFRFLYVLPIYCLLIARSKLKRLVLAIFLICSLVYLFNPKYHRENWRGLASELDDRVYMIKSFSDPIKYYDPEIQVADFEQIDGQEKMIKVVPYGVEIFGNNYRVNLTQLGYSQVTDKRFGELVLEGWEKVN